jgi:hypothetical protein
MKLHETCTKEKITNIYKCILKGLSNENLEGSKVV